MIWFEITNSFWLFDIFRFHFVCDDFWIPRWRFIEKKNVQHQNSNTESQTLNSINSNVMWLLSAFVWFTLQINRRIQVSTCFASSHFVLMLLNEQESHQTNDTQILSSRRGTNRFVTKKVPLRYKSSTNTWDNKQNFAKFSRFFRLNWYFMKTDYFFRCDFKKNIETDILALFSRISQSNFSAVKVAKVIIVIGMKKKP